MNSGAAGPTAMSLKSPFDRAEAEASQILWARACGVPVETTNSIGADIVVIPPGEYLRGRSPEIIRQEQRLDPSYPGIEWDTYRHHWTILTMPIYVGKHLVTQQSYAALMNRNPSKYSPTGKLASHVEGMNTDRFPVENVSWFDCVFACNVLSEREGFPAFYRIGPEMLFWDSGSIQEAHVEVVGGAGYRLLTSAEWEFVYRAGTTASYYYGDDPERSPWFENRGLPRPVGSDGPNNFGVFDLDSFYQEWCFDAKSLDSYAQFVDHAAVDPIDSCNADLERVTRGLNSYLQGGEHEGSSGDTISFRLCRSLDPGPNAAQRG